nr:8128_t:CDS:2 [Entrophospora candida]
MAKLPVDCLSEIFSYLENDIKSLHSCVLINRLWCEAALKYLWKKPFNQIIKASINSLREFPNMTYKSSFKFVNLSNTLFRCIVYNKQISSGIRNSQFGTAFNYVLFIRYLDFQTLIVVFAIWAKYIQDYLSPVDRELIAEILERKNTRDFIKYTNNLYSESVLIQIVENVAKLITLQIPRLESISITTSNNSKSFWNIYDNLHVEYPEVSNRCFSQIKRFEWTAGDNGVKFLTNFIRISRNIKVLKIDWDDHWFAKDDLYKNDDLLVNLIKNQNALEEFHMFFYTQNGIPKIIEGLEFQSKHLRKIVLKRNRIHDGGYITRILNLEGLEDLIIKHCWLETGERHWPVEKKLHSLVKFKFVLNDPILIIRPINYLTTTDFNDSSKLREFTYDENRFQMDFVTIAMHISTYFTNLVYLDLCIYITVPSLSEILLSCNKLEKIIVKDRGWKQNWQNEKNENILNIDKLMKEINLTKLRHLELKGVFSFSAHSLEQYLKKSNPPLEVMEILGSYDFGNEHLEVLLESLNVRLQKLSIESRMGLKRTLKAKATKIIKNFKYEFIKQKKSNQQLFDINTPYPNTRSRKKLDDGGGFTE